MIIDSMQELYFCYEAACNIDKDNSLTLGEKVCIYHLVGSTLIEAY